jgi:hypothetical protein
MRYVRLILVIGCIAALLTGCMGLSLFSSEHKHYYGDEESKQKLNNLEKRVERLEGAKSQGGLEHQGQEHGEKN